MTVFKHKSFISMLTCIAIISAFNMFFIFNAASQGVSINPTGSAADASAMLDISSTAAGLLIPRMTEAQKNLISSPATGLLVYQTDGTSPGVWYYDGTQWTQPGATGGTAHYVGEYYGGGLVFYVWDNGAHGFIVSLTDVSAGTTFSNVISGSVGTTNYWDGAANTAAIIAQPTHTASAAALCANYSGGGFSGWYLPSVDEYNMLYNFRTLINNALGLNGIANAYYWTSSELSATNALRYGMTYDGQSWTDAKTATGRVRCLRAF